MYLYLNLCVCTSSTSNVYSCKRPVSSSTILLYRRGETSHMGPMFRQVVTGYSKYFLVTVTICLNIGEGLPLACSQCYRSKFAKIDHLRFDKSANFKLIHVYFSKTFIQCIIYLVVSLTVCMKMCQYFWQLTTQSER